MGCDIHLYKEKLVNGVWVTADVWEAYDYGDDEKGIEVNWNNQFRDRNYNLFGLLSKGVRHEFDMSYEPRGLPFNISDEVDSRLNEDDHGHSYLYLFELQELMQHINSTTIDISGMKDADELKALEESNPKNWDLLYPYCQGTNARNAVSFKIDVPASFVMGNGLQKIIDSFDGVDGVDGDNHRIVFWFDN